MTTMYPAIVPYLLVADGAASLDFLRRAFGAAERMRVPGEGGRGIMHAEITVGSGLVMLAEPPAGDDGYGPPSGPSPVGIMVQLGTPAEVDRLYRQAIEAGGREDIAPRDEPWGSRFAGITDPSGHRWWLHAPLAAS